MGRAMIGGKLHSGQATVTTTATPLVAAPASGAGLRCGSGLVLYALTANAVTVYVGGPDVTTANGYALEAGRPVSVDTDDPSKVYVVCASGSPVVTWLYQ